MDVPAALPVQPDYKDRSTGLIVFGILGILMGMGCALIAPIAYFGPAIAAARTGAAVDHHTAFAGAALYGGLAVAFIWLGIGSILARRWARAIILCLSWFTLIIGLVALPAEYFALGSIGSHLQPGGRPMAPAALFLVRTITLATTSIIYIVIPGVAVLFYRSRHVRHTCEVRDPMTRWTDRCPLPVLALVLIKTFSAAMLLLIFPVYGHAYPLAGLVLQGLPARILWIGVAAFMLYAAWGFYRLDLRVWWIYLIGSLALWASSLITFARIGIIEYYRQTGMPERQLEQLTNNPLLGPNLLVILSGASMLAYAAYLLFVKRYFLAVKDHPAAA